MKRREKLTGPFFQFLGRVADLMILNVLFLMTAFPIVTMGAAMTAMSKIAQDMVCKRDEGIFMPYSQAFRENFKKATGGWLIVLAALVGAAAGLLAALADLSGAAGVILTVLAGGVLMVTVCVAVYLFPLIAHYQNTLREHFLNAALLAVLKLPRTVLLALIALLPFIVYLISPTFFMLTLLFWIAIGFGLQGYLASLLLKPVFRELEAADREGADGGPAESNDGSL